MNDEPARVTDPSLVGVRDELAAREPIFHHPELGTSREALDRQAAAEYEEVGASGRRYSREHVLTTVHDRMTRGVPDPPWELGGFHCVALGPDTYLLTYDLPGGRAADPPSHDLAPHGGRLGGRLPPGDRRRLTAPGSVGPDRQSGAMKLLTATREGQGDRDGDFCHAVEGELVFAGFVCATDRSDPDGGCGCGRAFSGLNSLRATTTALVRDLDLTYDDVRMALAAHFVAAGMGPDVLDATDFEEMLDEEVEQTIHYAQVWEPGAIVGRRLDSVHLRTTAVR